MAAPISEHSEFSKSAITDTFVENVGKACTFALKHLSSIEVVGMLEYIKQTIMFRELIESEQILNAGETVH